VVAVNSAGASADSKAVSTTTLPAVSTSALAVQYWTYLRAASTNSIAPMVKLVNRGNSAVTLGTVTVRYFFTPEGSAPLRYTCDYAPRGCGSVTSRFVTSSGVTYLELGFGAGAGTLAAGQSTEIQGRIFKGDWSGFDQANDFSFDGAKTSFADWDRIAAYISGVLAWGVEPAPVRPAVTASPSTPTALR
jgi:hypothetical protein